MNDVITFKTRDEFNRLPFAKRLIDLLKNENNLFPMSINGAWGTGKTEFCRKTVHLINQEYSKLFVAEYFDAFQEDRFNDPITSILAKLYLTFDGKWKRSKPIAVMTKVIAAEAAQKTLEIMLPPSLASLAKEVPSVYKKIKEQCVKENFENRAKLDEYLKDLKRIIDQVAGDKKFVLFIDELDRCRPDYALHLLEVVKHVFDIPKMKIVFIINPEQLVEIIKHSYGNNDQIARKYLDKFFQLQIRLPNVALDSNFSETSNSVTYLRLELKKYGMPDHLFFKTEHRPMNDSGIHLFCLLDELAEFIDLSFRDIEKLVKYIHVCLTFNTNLCKLDLGHRMIVLYAIFQFALNGRLYQNYRYFSDPFKDDDEWLMNCITQYSKRNILHEILYSENSDNFKPFFYGWTPDMDMNYRRDFFIQAFHTIDNLLMI